MVKKIILGIGILLLLIQFVRIDKENPIVNEADDFITITQPAEDVALIIKNSCYDCHSNESKYPWYSNIAPVSWVLEHHIEEGREHFNFSEWGTYTKKEQSHIAEECAEEVEEGEMPLAGYVMMHSEANLTNEQKEKLEQFFESLE